jgi:hypothetical protein
MSGYAENLSWDGQRQVMPIPYDGTHRQRIPHLGVCTLVLERPAAGAGILREQKGSAAFNHDGHLIFRLLAVVLLIA